MLPIKLVKVKLTDYLNFKKIRFLLLAALLVFFPVYFDLALGLDSFKLQNFLIFIVFAGVSGVLVQFMEKGRRSFQNLFFTFFAAAFVIAGFIGSLHYFPNLGLYVKLIGAGCFGIILYSLFLVNNVVIVVDYRNTVIPLYRAAVSWSQVIVLGSSIPAFATIFKLNVFPPIQLGLVFVSTYILSNYLIWVYRFDSDSKKVLKIERVTLCGSLSFIVALAALSVSFLPAESFMRAVFTAASLLGCMNYLYLYLKNALSKKFVNGFYALTTIFFLAVFLFS